MEMGYIFWKGLVSPACALANNYNWEWLCYLTPFAFPYINTPLFIQAEQYDTYQVTSNCNCNPPFNSQEAEYVATVRLSFFSSLHTIRPENAVFSAACFHHCSSEDDSFFTIKIDNITMAEALGYWYNLGNSLSKVKLIDTCPSFNCSVGCPAAPY
eukprot:TRINITY_DN4525_c0_g1_i2.p1 TRINITY_DN4525_c0_g1~~TRINITY_DN4525_c0_g1_i2.p1  ORF type:complete len:156 (-),score=20.38 TRINITY_DN4525_c0_g1_i2:130-597(-)